MPKPVRKRKRFIDKRRDNVQRFLLVHRSQHDPLATDSAAPQRVLQPVDERQKQKGQEIARKEEQIKYGVYFDDDYNYLQHLRAKSENDEERHVEWEEVDKLVVKREDGKRSHVNQVQLQLPSSVFATKYEEPVGLLNKMAPRGGPLVDVNPEVLEVLETLDDAFEVEKVVKAGKLAAEDDDDDDDELDDILSEMVRAEKEESGADDLDDEDEYYDEEEEDGSSGSPYYYSENDEVPDLDERFLFDKEETKSKFTEYSMTSSVIKRSEQLSTLDDRFEAFFDKYEDENTGALDMDEIAGHKPVTSSIMTQLIEEFDRRKVEDNGKPDFGSGASSSKHVQPSDTDDEDKGVTELLEVEAPHEKWDCESIISTYSNLYHHPKLISEDRKKIQPIEISRGGIPKNVLGKGLTVGALKQLDRLNMTTGRDSDNLEMSALASKVSELSVRNKHETAEEKKARKKAMKDYRRDRRLEKKANTSAFKKEKLLQERNAMNITQSQKAKKIA